MIKLSGKIKIPGGVTQQGGSMRFGIHFWEWELGMDLLWIEHGGVSIWKRMILFRILISLYPLFNLGFSARPEGGLSLDFFIWPFHLDCGHHFLDLCLRRRSIYKLRKYKGGWKKAGD